MENLFGFYYKSDLVKPIKLTPFCFAHHPANSCSQLNISGGGYQQIMKLQQEGGKVAFAWTALRMTYYS